MRGVRRARRKWGEWVTAVVELKDGESVEADELIKLCKDRLGSVKTPKKSVIFEGAAALAGGQGAQVRPPRPPDTRAITPRATHIYLWPSITASDEEHRCRGPPLRSRPIIATVATLALAAAAVLVTALPAQAAVGCRVAYAVTSQWPGGFGANVVNNLGDPVAGWRLTWSFTAGQTITQLWNGTVTQSGAQVTVNNAAWNGSVGTGANVASASAATWNTVEPRSGRLRAQRRTCTGSAEPPQPDPRPSPGPSPAPASTS